MQPDLDKTIADLYETFGNYRIGDHVAGCPCCVSDEQQQRLVQKRLRDLSGDDLEKFSFSALTTFGTLKDFKHFLPRILELKAHGELSTELQIIYGKVTYEGPWSENEMRALSQFTQAFFTNLVSQLAMAGQARTRWISPIDVLESAGLVGLDVRAILANAFPKKPTPTPTPLTSAAHASAIADLIQRQAAAFTAGTSRWTWWKTDRDRLVETWLLSGRAYEILERAFEANPNDPDSGAWAEACDVLEALGGRQ